MASTPDAVRLQFTPEEFFAGHPLGVFACRKIRPSLTDFGDPKLPWSHAHG